MMGFSGLITHSSSLHNHVNYRYLLNNYREKIICTEQTTVFGFYNTDAKNNYSGRRHIYHQLLYDDTVITTLKTIRTAIKLE